MTAEANAPARPRPEPMIKAIPFFEGTKAGKILVQKCTNCSEYTWYSHFVCPNCMEDTLEWVESTGKGKIYTFTVVYQHNNPFFMNKVPYVYGVVELDEGPRLVSNIEGIDPEAVRCDMRVEATFEKLDDEITVPIFKVVG